MLLSLLYVLMNIFCPISKVFLEFNLPPVTNLDASCGLGSVPVKRACNTKSAAFCGEDFTMFIKLGHGIE